ncbi:MAG: FAD-dependent oxidoreductase, partial [Hyphomicrobiales bacterium]|nr:FAD-dependent oxidoreductase [Hyphomicrobiales bacterium]
MAHIVVVGGGIGGLSVVYELKEFLRKDDKLTLVSNKAFFQFTPSNPWVAVSWRKKKDITVELAPLMRKHGVNFTDAGAKRVDPENNRVELYDGSSIDYDYLVIGTGPDLAFDEIEGLGPNGFTNSVCDVDHATGSSEIWAKFCKEPGPVIVGAVQGASCYGPAYEFAMIMDTDLRKKKCRDKVPMT